MTGSASVLRPLAGLARKPFVRHVAMVATGTALAQAITLAFYPVITRLYDPEAFGVLGVFMSAVAVFASFAGLAYPIAIVLPRSDRNARGLARLSLMIAVVIAAAVTLLLAAFSGPVVTLLGLEQIAPFVFLLPAVILLATVLATTQQWLIRTRQFSVTARVAVLQALVVNGAKAGFGLAQPLASTLIIVATAGIALHAAMLALGERLSRSRREDPFPDEPEKSLPELARIHRDFPLFRAPQELLNALSHGLPVILLAAFYSPAAAGFYALAYSVLAAPITLVGNSVGNVLYPRLAEAANRGEDLRRLVLLPTGALFLIGLIPFGAIMAAGPTLFAFVFGEAWREAGEYARWLALWTLFMLSNTPSVKAIPVIGKQHLHLSFGILVVLVRAFAIWTGYHLMNSAVYSIALHAVSGAVLNMVLVGFVLHRLRDVRGCDVPK